MNAALVGGHIDMMIAGTDEIAGLVAGAYDERPGYAAPKEFAELFESEYKTFTDYLKSEEVLKKDYYSK